MTDQKGKQMDEGTQGKEDAAAFTTALHGRLKAIVEREFTAQMLLELEHTAQLCRQMLGVGKGRKPRRGQGGYGTYVGDIDYAEPGPPMLQMPIGEEIIGPYEPRAETFGAKMIRELIPAIMQLAQPKPVVPTVTDLVFALRTAKDNGLTEVAKSLEQQLVQQLGTQLPGSSEPSAVPIEALPAEEGAT